VGIGTHGRTTHTQIQQTTKAVSTYYNMADLYTTYVYTFLVCIYIHKYNDTKFDPVIIKLFLILCCKNIHYSLTNLVT